MQWDQLELKGSTASDMQYIIYPGYVYVPIELHK